MQNVAPSGALARQSRQMLQLAFVIVAAGIFVAVVGLALYVVPLAVPSNAIFPFYNFLRGLLLFLGIGGALAGLALAARAYFTRVDNDLARVTANFLTQYPELDDRYWFIRNINKSGLGYIDAVLVGPPGVLVFRITDVRGKYFNEKGNWLQENAQGQLMPARNNPTRDDIVDINAVREYLTKNGLRDIPVYGVVVFSRYENTVQVMVKEPVVPVAHLPQLISTLQDNYLARERISQNTVDAVVDRLYDR
jgi:hypothetical protein